MGTNFVSQELAAETELVKRKRRTYSDDFKRELIQKCHHPHISIARVALEHGINTNLLNRWVIFNEKSIDKPETLSIFIAISIERESPKEICFKIQIRTAHQSIQLTWPATEMVSLAQLMRELTA